MNPPGPELRIRRMTRADLDQVIEIAESLKEAPTGLVRPTWPRWSPSCPLRIALLARSLWLELLRVRRGQPAAGPGGIGVHCGCPGFPAPWRGAEAL